VANSQSKGRDLPWDERPDRRLVHSTRTGMFTNQLAPNTFHDVLMASATSHSNSHRSFRANMQTKSEKKKPAQVGGID